MIAVDTDVLAVYFIFRWDSRFEHANSGRRLRPAEGDYRG